MSKNKLTVFKRNDFVVFMDANEQPRVGLVASATGSAEAPQPNKDWVVVYELGKRHEVHKSQVKKVQI